MKVLIEGVGLGPVKAVRVERDEDSVLLHLLSADSQGGWIRLGRDGARMLAASLKVAAEAKK